MKFIKLQKNITKTKVLVYTHSLLGSTLDSSATRNLIIPNMAKIENSLQDMKNIFVLVSNDHREHICALRAKSKSVGGNFAPPKKSGGATPLILL